MNSRKALSLTLVRSPWLATVSRGARGARLALLALLVTSCADPITPALDLTPASQTLVSGQALQLTVSRRFPGGPVEDVTSRVTYTTTNLAVAVVTEQGVVTAGAVPGAVIVKASDVGSDATAVATFQVVAARIASIEVTPAPATVLAPGAAQAFTAMARLDNGTARDVTRDVIWSSSNEAAATVGNALADKGVVRAVLPGDATILATDGATQVQGRSTVLVSGQVAQLKALVVTPDPALVALGKTVAFRADGIYSDQSTKDLTRVVTWSSSRPDLASVDTVGVVTGVVTGDATITAVGPEPFTSLRGSAAVKVAP